MNRVLLVLVILGAGAVGCAGNPQSEEQSTAAYKNLTAPELREMLATEDFSLVDVHIPEQRHIAGTDLFVAFNEIEKHQGELPTDKAAKIVIYCRSGNMSMVAAAKLAELGYTDVYNLKGGVNAWIAAGYSLE